jgi:2-polyprenyl-3-methyl-5-hydroxy-6-metoxy-1,4-benzoquinol methylase
MKYIIDRPKNNDEKNLFIKIDGCVDFLHLKLKSVDLAGCGLSLYNQRYLKEYLDNYLFFSRFYTQVLIAGLRGLEKPVKDAVFLDYGGGSGFFSLLAKEVGFKTVIYNDIYDVSVGDAKILSRETGIGIDYFICGDAGELVSETQKLHLSVDLICSFEVIEHIYDLKKWFWEIGKIEGHFSMICSSSANIKNPYIRRKLAKVQRKAEFIGSEKQVGSKDRDTFLPFLEVRKGIIRENFPGLLFEEIESLAHQTRGYEREDLLEAVSQKLSTGAEIKKISHLSNTCDPITGNWAEHLISHRWLKRAAAKAGFAEPQILPGLYTWSGNQTIFLLKKILNIFIRIFGNKGVMFSPIYIFITKK